MVVKLKSGFLSHYFPKIIMSLLSQKTEGHGGSRDGEVSARHLSEGEEGSVQRQQVLYHLSMDEEVEQVTMKLLEGVWKALEPSSLGIVSSAMPVAIV